MKKVILTLVMGLFFVAFSNAQSKGAGAAELKTTAKKELKIVKKEANSPSTAYTVNKSTSMSIAAKKKTCAGKASCAGKGKVSCAGKDKASCAGKDKASCSGDKPKGKAALKKAL